MPVDSDGKTAAFSAEQDNATAGKLLAACVVGTRPEVIKMAPVIKCMNRSSTIKPVLISVGQHSNLLDMTIADMNLQAEYHLEINRSRSSLVDLTARVSQSLETLFETLDPAFVVAQGDTNSVLASCLTAFYCNISFVHVEAGLRSRSIRAPFPEEFNRRVVAVGTSIHCAPTTEAAANLVGEGVPSEQIVVTGNTGIDAVLDAADKGRSAPVQAPDVDRLILMTAHRRENFGGKLEEAFGALRRFVDETPDVGILFPVHPNPLAGAAAEALAGHDRIVLSRPLSYSQMVAALQASWLVVTDSGGLQEEGPALGKPVLVMRESTERPEAIAAGNARLVGTGAESILEALRALDTSPALYARMSVPAFPFGDGHAAQRIVSAMEAFAARNGKPGTAVSAPSASPGNVNIVPDPSLQ